MLILLRKSTSTTGIKNIMLTTLNRAKASRWHCTLTGYVFWIIFNQKKATAALSNMQCDKNRNERLMRNNIPLTLLSVHLEIAMLSSELA